MNKKETAGVFGGLIAIIVIILLFASIGTVSAGNIGVKTRFGKVVGTIQPGLYFQTPFIEGVTQMDVQTQKDQTDATAASNDLQSVTATVAVNYHVEPSDASTIFQNIGANYADRVISPAIQEAIKSVTANYTAGELITKRETVRDQILVLLTQKLQTYGVQTDSLNIVNFAFSEQFNQAIESKVTAQQNAEAAQNKLVQTQAEASSTIISAEAQAQSIKIQAQAVNSQGGADYVQLQAIQKWDGHLPASMIPGATVPFINLSK